MSLNLVTGELSVHCNASTT